MKNIQWLFLIVISLFSANVLAEDPCPYSIKGATVMLTLQNEVNLKISSSAMCNQKIYFADRFVDADVEVWKMGKLVGKFYSRRVSYDMKSLKIILQNSLLLDSEIILDKKAKEVNFMMIDLKNNRVSSSLGETRF